MSASRRRQFLWVGIIVLAVRPGPACSPVRHESTMVAIQDGAVHLCQAQAFPQENTFELRCGGFTGTGAALDVVKILSSESGFDPPRITSEGVLAEAYLQLHHLSLTDAPSTLLFEDTGSA